MWWLRGCAQPVSVKAGAGLYALPERYDRADAKRVAEALGACLSPPRAALELPARTLLASPELALRGVEGVVFIEITENFPAREALLERLGELRRAWVLTWGGGAAGDDSEALLRGLREAALDNLRCVKADARHPLRLLSVEGLSVAAVAKRCGDAAALLQVIEVALNHRARLPSERGWAGSLDYARGWVVGQRVRRSGEPEALLRALLGEEASADAVRAGERLGLLELTPDGVRWMAVARDVTDEGVRAGLRAALAGAGVPAELLGVTSAEGGELQQLGVTAEGGRSGTLGLFTEVERVVLGWLDGRAMSEELRSGLQLLRAVDREANWKLDLRLSQIGGLVAALRAMATGAGPESRAAALLAEALTVASRRGERTTLRRSVRRLRPSGAWPRKTRGFGTR